MQLTKLRQCGRAVVYLLFFSNCHTAITQLGLHSGQRHSCATLMIPCYPWRLRRPKVLPTLRHLSYEERLSALQLPGLKQRWGRGETFKILKGLDNVDRTAFFCLSESITRGNNLKLYKHGGNILHPSSKNIHWWQFPPFWVGKTGKILKFSYFSMAILGSHTRLTEVFSALGLDVPLASIDRTRIL